MKNNLVVEKQENKPAAADFLLKATALLYLQDALQRERYEECALLIQSAKNYGAGQGEISEIIAKHIRRLNTGPNEANVARVQLFSFKKGGS